MRYYIDAKEDGTFLHIHGTHRSAAIRLESATTSTIALKAIKDLRLALWKQESTVQVGKLGKP